MSRVWLVLSALVSRRFRYVTLIVLVGMGVLVRLGIWQLDRLAQRQVQNAQLQQVWESSPLWLTGEFPTQPLIELQNRKTAVTGTFDFSHQLFIKLQNYQGQTGGYLVAPLRIEGSETAVLINRGWIPDDQADVTKWQVYEEPGILTVQGVIALSEATDAAAAPTAPQIEWYRIDVASIANQLPYPILPFYVVQSPEGANQTLPYRLETEIDLSEGSHLSYAVQWFLFATILATIYLVYVHKNIL